MKLPFVPDELEFNIFNDCDSKARQGRVMKRHLPRKSCLAIVLLFDLKKVINLLSPSSVVCKIGWSDLFCLCLRFVTRANSK